MARNTAQRRQALLDIFDAHEEVCVLLACLPRSPAIWDDDGDAELEIIKDNLIEKGLLTYADGFVTTTPEGCAAIITYVRGDDVIDDEVSIEDPNEDEYWGYGYTESEDE